MDQNPILAGILGVCVGDALGVPVEFVSREKLTTRPVIDMTGFGTHHQPPGTWSDDSSLTLCLVESLCHGFDLSDIANNFSKWLNENHWTPRGQVFDIGVSTQIAINKIKEVSHPQLAGGTSDQDNGNGSLMRILPLAFYVRKLDQQTKFNIIAQVSSITHAHQRSIIACSIYIQMIIYLLQGNDKKEAYKKTQRSILDHFHDDTELIHFYRLLENDITTYVEKEIKSSGYVVDTLEASIWSFLTTNNFKQALLRAVNLGEDTDTVGAVTGGLAGIHYGLKSIPAEWLNQLARKQDILKLVQLFSSVYQ